jgi:hypothetical protein
MAFTIFPHKPESGTNRIKISKHSSEELNKKRGCRGHCVIDLQQAEAWLVEASETTRLSPKANQLVLEKLQVPIRRSNPQLVCVKPAHLPIE